MTLFSRLLASQCFFRVLSVLGLGLLLYPSSLQARVCEDGQSLTAPPGFHWRSCRIADCSFLVPDGWAFQRYKDDKALRFEMTPKASERKTPPVIRISIIRNLESLIGLSVERHIELVVSQFHRDREILNVWENSSRPLSSTAVMSIHPINAEKTLKKFDLLIRNDREDTLYMLTFETAPMHWEEDWQAVEPVLASMRLDENL